MARGTSRAPSQNAYRGSLGRTQTTTVHVTGPHGEDSPTTVHTTVDASADPALADKLRAGTLNNGVAVPVLYHDPSAELLVLVLGDAHRHREIEERISVLERLRADTAAIPAYAKDFTVVYGGAALADVLDNHARKGQVDPRIAELEAELDKRTRDAERASRELERAKRETETRTRDLETRTNDLEARSNELATRTSELATRTHELDARTRELDTARDEIELLRQEARARVLAAVPQPQPVSAGAQVTDFEVVDAADVVETTTTGPAPTAPTAPIAETAPTAPKRENLIDDDDDDDEEDGMEDDSVNVPVDVSVALVPAPTRAQKNVKRVTGAPAPAKNESDTEDSETGETVALPGRSLDTEGFEQIPTQDVDAAGLAVSAARAATTFEFDEETTGNAIIPSGADPLTTQTAERPTDLINDDWLDKVASRDQSSVIAEPKGLVRLALVAREQIARGLGGNLDLRVLLQRTTHYPVVTLVLGPPAAMRVPSPNQLAVVPLDIANDVHRAVLTALARKFELTVDVVVRGQRIRRVLLTGPIAENIGYVLRAADDHLRALKGGGAASFERGRDEVLAPGYDLLGLQHADHGEFRDDKLAQLATAQQLRRAIAMARRFVRPSREDYLVCTRGFPLTRWRELRRHVLQSAVAWGIWMGPELAQVAVSEGLARSRRDLIVRLDAGFEKLKTHPTAYDIDQEAADDNAKAIAEEARALGVELPKAAATNGEHTNGRGRAATHAPVTSEDMPEVAGSIGGTPPSGVPRQKSTDDLLAELDDRNKRVAAALELCERGDARAAASVIGAVTKMSRAEAVRVLGMSVKFGDAAAKPLIEGLASSKGFLRHGCALALALLRTEDGTQAVIDLLLAEPTEIWREIARAIGQVGPQGLLPLAANFGRLGDRATPQIAERVAWAMAHIAVRGGKPAVETMAHGQSVVAPVARQALELHASAANDQVRVRPGMAGSQVGKDITVNRAFSRRFFEALEQGLPEASAAGLEALDASGPMELLDESDLLVEDDDEAELDESDLLT